MDAVRTMSRPNADLTSYALDGRAARLFDAAVSALWNLPILGPALAAAERRKVPSTPLRATFVCKGNICRSIYAELVARKACDGAPGWSLRSAGLEAREGTVSPETAVAVAAERGIALAGHRSRRIEASNLAAGDVVFVMQPHQKLHHSLRKVADGVPVVLLGAWCHRRGPTASIDDPYGREASSIREVFGTIEDAVLGLVAPDREGRRS